jgi:hypothetical protein
MSTKTSFKRIALVAVAALGFGTLSVVPSSAAVPQSDTVTVTPTTTTPYYVGGTYTATVAVTFGALASGDSMTTTMSMTTTATASAAYPVLSLETPTVTRTTANPVVSGTPVTIMTTTESGTAFAAAGVVKPVAGSYLVTFSPDKLGTYQIQFKNSGGTNNASATWVVAVVAKPTITVETFAKRDVDTRVTKNYSNSAWPTWQAATGKVLGTGLWQTWSESDRNAAEEIVAVTGRGTDDLTFACSATVIANATQPNSTGLGSCMNVKITQKNGMITANTGMMVDADAVPLTVSVTGPANASVNGYGAAGVYSTVLGETVTAAKAFNGNIIPGVLYTETALQNTDLGLNKYVYVYSNGTPGVATVTIKAGTLVLETFTVNFYGAPALVTPTVVNEVIQVSASADLVKTSATYQANNPFSVAGTNAISGVVTDSASVKVPGQTVTTLSDELTIITNKVVACVGTGVGGVTDATGAVKCTLVGAKEGLAKVTLTAGTAVSAASQFRVGGLPTQTKIQFGDAKGVAKTDFVPGEQGTFDIRLLDAKGMSVPNGTYTDFFSSSVATTPQDLLSSYAFAAQAVPSSTTQSAFLYGSKSPVTGLTAELAAKVNGDGGIQRWMVNMPVNASDVELSVTGFIAGVAITKAVATVAPDKTVQAAADLAAEALDAATAAIDAANIAAENADAATAAAMEATDAVAALAVTTQAQIASMRLQNIALRKQIIALTNLIIKIQKKVKA